MSRTDDTPEAGEGAFRIVKLPRDVELKLVQYARAKRIKPELAATEAIAAYLREHADIAIRIGDARRALEKSRDG